MGPQALKSWVRGARRALRKLLAPPRAVVTMVGGYRMGLRPRSDALEMKMYLDRTYEPGTLAFFGQMLRAGDTMVDVGANLGLMTLHAAAAVGPKGRVIAIEAHPATYARLARNIKLNRLTNVQAINEAAGAVAEEGRAIYEVPSVNIGRASLVEPHEGHRLAGSVPVRRLDDMLEGVEDIRLLKIDVEGFEAEVLRGAVETLAKRPIICMEVVTSESFGTDEDPLTAHRIIMATGGYSCRRFAGSKFSRRPVLAAVRSEDELSGFHDNLVYMPI